jgi:uncharacterized membrane protein YkoI
MNRKSLTTKWIVTGALAVVALGAGTGIAVAGGGGEDSNETPATGSALEQASEAALAETGGGEVSGSEVGDEEGYYEIEVTLDDGSQVDVHLDRDFKVLSTEADGAGEDESTESK